jgi:diguanylate cyclase (GGDEF)-like protein/PAS domain S-box-containing protein
MKNLGKRIALGSVRSYLVALVLGVAVPLVLFALVQTTHSAQHQRELAEWRVIDRARAAAVAVHRDVEATTAALNALASSRELDRDDLKGFYEVALRVREHQPWYAVWLADVHGNALLNLLKPFGTELPSLAKWDYVSRVVESRKPVISGLLQGRLTSGYHLAVSVPVVREDRVKYVLTAGLKPDRLSALLASQQEKGTESIASILDRDYTVLARTVGADKWVGRRASPQFIESVRNGADGVEKSVSIDGKSVYVAFRTLPETGWTVAVGVPAAELDGPLEEAILGTAILGVLLLLVSLGGAVLAGRRIAMPLSALASAAREMAQARTVEVKDDGSVAEITTLAGALRNANDVMTKLRQAQEALYETKEQFQQLAKHIPEAFWITDLQRHVMIYASPAFERIHGARVRSMRGVWRAWKQTLHPEDRLRVLAAHRNMATGPTEVQYRIVRPDGATRWVRACGYPVEDSNGVVYRVAGTIEDITERRELEDRLHYQAHFDSLTGLPNRVLFFDRLAQALAQAQRSSHKVAVLFVDIDRFKVINDTLGHGIGDQLLKRAAESLARSIRVEDTVARLAGDEFAIVLPRIDRPEDAALVAEKVLSSLAAPFDIDGQEVLVTGSVGVAISSVDGMDAEALVKNADTAMFRAKNSGRNAYEFYTAEMNDRALEQLELERRLRRALERNEFVLHYQPKTHVATGEITGCEALLRWSGPDGRIVPPAQFVRLLEETGLIMQVGEWVIRTACKQIADWRRANVTVLPIAVNVSAKQFSHRGLAAVVESALREYGVEGSLLEVELTESAAMQNPEDAIVTLGKLKALRVQIAIDDFGTGYSSLSYLKRLPIDVLKIDRSFVTGLPHNENDASITKAIIMMAHSLGLKVVAEGVEQRQQLRFLAENGCDNAQGYLFSRPVPAAEMARMAGAQVLDRFERQIMNGAYSASVH